MTDPRAPQFDTSDAPVNEAAIRADEQSRILRALTVRGLLTSAMDVAAVCELEASQQPKRTLARQGV